MHKEEHKKIEPVKTDKLYTLFIKGVLTLNWDDLDFLRDALATVSPTRNTFILYNEEGVRHHEATKVN